MAALLRHRLLVLILAVAAVAIAAVGLSRAGSTDATRTAPSIADGLQRVPLSTPLPSDPDVLTGKFDNGFRFYIRRNTAPLGRAELRLDVNAGSVLEKDDQRGLAHFVEHMAFNGTTHFPKQAIASFLQSVGMRFGPSVNATTGFDETVYSLEIPTDRPDVAARSMQILEDWAHQVTFDPAEVDRERGVVIEEWRQRRGVGQRLQEAQLGLLFTGSPYADRAAIGTLESLQRVTADRVRTFYADWYRPDLMAIVAVGDFQPPEIERLVRKHFAALKAKTGAARPVVDVPPPSAPVFEVISDKEATGATLGVHTRYVPPSQATVGDYRREIAERLAVGMFSARLAESSQRAGSPLLNARATRGRPVRTQDVVTFSTVLHSDAIDKGAGVLFLELERIERFGFTAEELERLKTATLRGVERAVAEKNNRPSSTLAAEYIRHFTRGEPFPGLLYEFDLTKRFLPEITLEEVNAIAAAWLTATRTVVLSAPDKPGVRVPPRDWLARAMSAADASTTLTPYVAPKSNQPLLESLPAGGTVVKTTTRDAIGITEWTLSNGARVVLKPTTFKDDEIVFTALSAGGTSLAPDEDYVPAQTAAQVVTSLGVGRFASGDLRRALTGKVAGVRPLITPFEEGLAGGGSARDLEALFQLVYLYFTQPRHDPVLFRALTTQMRTGLATQTATPDFAFASALGAAVTQNHPRARSLTPDTVVRMGADPRRRDGRHTSIAACRCFDRWRPELARSALRRAGPRPLRVAPVRAGRRSADRHPYDRQPCYGHARQRAA
jgi:zinc protease